MEVTRQSTAKYGDHYEIRVGEKISLTTTVVRDQDYKLSEPAVRGWINSVRRMYGNNKRNAQHILVGLSALATQTGTWRKKVQTKRTALTGCYSYVPAAIAFSLGYSPMENPSQRSSKDFLYGGTRVVGLGTEKMAEKHERDYGFLIPQRVELRKLAMQDRACEGDDLSKCNLEAVARAVLEGKVDVTRPSKMSWFKDRVGCEYSDYLIKYVSVEAFTVQRIGTKLLGNWK